MINNKNKNAFTLVELLAVIVILAVVILIAVTAVIPRMNNAKKKALVDEALMYLKAAKESMVFDAELSPSCINVSNLNEKYIKKSSDSYTGVIKNEYVNGELSQTINLTNGSLYIVGTDNLTSSDVKSNIPKGFASSCSDYNPILAENADTNTLSYKLLMSEGGSTLDANLNIINQRTLTVNFNNVETDSSKSGMYKSEDDDGASFYYRGVINNNWIEFGGFYWRIIRINGDGSIRLVYSGLKNSTHTGNDALILASNNSVNITFGDTTQYNINTIDISGLTNTNITTSYSNGVYGSNTYLGYMYNPRKILYSYPSYNISSSDTLDKFPKNTGIKNSVNNYYFFKDFDLNTDCIVGNSYDESGACTLKCRNKGVDCVSRNWNTLATTEGNYSTIADGVYPATNPTNYIYTSPYKYTCWHYSDPVEVSNSDGTTSVYISCPIVTEIVGTIKDNKTSARVRYHGLFSESENETNLNIKDSNIKRELDLWYQNNILNINDSTNLHKLEDYIADEVFCNDRIPKSKFPYEDGYYDYKSYDRISVTNKAPSFKCKNINRDGFSLNISSESIVDSKNVGNMALKYPVGLPTGDEVIFAGGGNKVDNLSYFMNIGSKYYTMTPSYSSESNLFSYGYAVLENGRINSYAVVANIGVRPVINLKASVLYDSGSGTEADPYKVKLAS